MGPTGAFGIGSGPKGWPDPAAWEPDQILRSPWGIGQFADSGSRATGPCDWEALA
jgi:hypothetical protein